MSQSSTHRLTFRHCAGDERLGCAQQIVLDWVRRRRRNGRRVPEQVVADPEYADERLGLVEVGQALPLEPARDLPCVHAQVHREPPRGYLPRIHRLLQRVGESLATLRLTNHEPETRALRS